MSDEDRPGRIRGWRFRRAASPAFQSWASRFLLTRGRAKAEGEALFDLVAGFVHSQVLYALVDLRILHKVLEHPATPDDLAAKTGVPPDRLHVLLQAGAALGLLRRRRGGRFGGTVRGAALLGVPGLETMILHHRAFYRDLEDPTAFFRAPGETELSRLWPYVLGGEAGPEEAARYSRLMAESQGLVAEETLRTLSLRNTEHLLDVGGGTGAFLAAAASAYPDMKATLFDLPHVVAGAGERLSAAGVRDRVEILPGNFREDPLPIGADTVSLVRVLYDHEDTTVAGLLAQVRATLPTGGRVVISEPMSGGPRPERAGDAYFALYTLAMGTGKTRTPAEIMGLLRRAGFARPRHHRTRRPFVTSVVTAEVAGV